MTFKRLTKHGGRRLARGAARFLAPCLLACLLCGVAAAYTVVMRGGRRVDIPGEFKLTRTTLTYETAPGVAVTLPLDHVDVEATERANGEPAGSFLRRAQIGTGALRQEVTEAAPVRAARRTITNRDLETVRRARVQSERDYERRRTELGLPSAEEMRRHEERDTEHMRELARQKAVEDAAAERQRRARDDYRQAETFALNADEYDSRRHAADLYDDSSGYFALDALTVVVDGRASYGRRFPPSFRTSPRASSRGAGFGTWGRFGAWHRPRGRHGAGFGVNGGTRGVVGFRWRGAQGRPAGRR